MKLSVRARRAIPLTVLLIGSVVLLLLVARQSVRAYLELQNMRRVQAGEMIGVRPWMTLPYIANTYQVPENALFEAVGLPPTRRNRHAPLEVLARTNGRNLDELIAAINATIDAHGGVGPTRRLPPMPHVPGRPSPPLPPPRVTP